MAMSKFIKTVKAPVVTHGRFTERTRALPAELWDQPTTPELSGFRKFTGAVNRALRIGEFATGFAAAAITAPLLVAEAVRADIDFAPPDYWSTSLPCCC